MCKRRRKEKKQERRGSGMTVCAWWETKDKAWVGKKMGLIKSEILQIISLIFRNHDYV